MGWLPNYPTNDTRIKEIPKILQDNFTHIENILNIEHRTLTSAGSGQHDPGRMSVVYEGTTAQINALTNVPSGALAYDTTIGYLKKYTGSSWQVMTNIHSRMRAYASSASSVTLASSQSASGDWVIFDTEDYDELSEYDNTTGIFTAQGSGDYLIIACIAVCANNPVPTTTAIGSATSNDSVQWAYTGATTNYDAIDEYPTANDADYVITRTSGKKDKYNHSQEGQTPVPLGASSMTLSVAFRAKSAGCICNSTCYGYSSCSCNNTCYGFTCTCNGTCYGYTSCSCNSTCYGYSCSCNGTCYGYSSCSCDMTCDFMGCTCGCNYTCYGYSSCSCDNTCYGYSGCPCNNTCYGYTSCSCNSMCYGQTKCGCDSACYGYACTCNATCYGYSSCSCNSACYGYAPCGCNQTCYNQGKSCTCHYQCYGYAACSCNYTCYGYSSCSCDNTCYNEVSCTCNNTCYQETGGSCTCENACYGYVACTCNNTCYNESATTVAPLIALGASATEYEATPFQLASSFQNLEYTWSVSPSTGLDWLRDEIHQVAAFGLKAYNDGGATTACSAIVSQAYLIYTWYPTLPVFILRVYKNNVETVKVFQPIIDRGSESDQTILLKTLLRLNPNDTIRIALVKVSAENDYIVAGSPYTFLAIHRVEGQCV